MIDYAVPFLPCRLIMTEGMYIRVLAQKPSYFRRIKWSIKKKEILFTNKASEKTLEPTHGFAEY